MSTTHRNIGAYFVPKVGVKPDNISGSTPVNGTGFDRTGALSCKLIAAAGAATGAPDAQAHVAKLQDSADDSTYADITGATVTLIADNSLVSADVDLSSAKQYIRAVLTPGFTAGSGPTNDVYVGIDMGGVDVLPAA